MSAVWAAWSPEWLLYSKVTFDGKNKIIFVHPEVTTLDIRADLYSAWVAWIVLQDNIKFLPAVRVTGYDPIGGGMYTGDNYFLINGWKLSINLQKVRVSGVLFSDNYDTAYYTPELVAQYPATVSALTTTVSTGGAGASAIEVRQEMDNNSSKLLSIQTNITPLQTDIDDSLVKIQQIKTLLDSLQIPTANQNADAVWNSPINIMTDKTTIGGYISKTLLSVPKFLGLK